MPDEPLTTLYFVSRSQEKYEDYQFLLGKYADLRWMKLIVDEPKTMDSDVLIRRKIEAIRPHLPHLPFLVEQTCLMIDAWHRLPGSLTDVFMEAVGNEGICDMLAAYPEANDRTASAITDLAYHAPAGRVQLFRGAVDGHIAPAPKGEKGRGWDAIFIPAGFDKTVAEMTLETRYRLSTRMLAVNQFYASVLDHKLAGKVAQNRVRLQQLIARHFNKTELADLFYALEIDPEEILTKVIKREQVRELILFCDRHGRIPDLLEACLNERPNVAWPEFA
jgi:non-canonical purine NTP pyrophosphatase (RdgB/HAM1 family)